MKSIKQIVVLLVVIFLAGITLSQSSPKIAKRSPRIMLIPSDQWMLYNGFLKQDNVPNYPQAFIESKQLSFLTVQFNNSMSSQGITVTSLEEYMKNIDYQSTQTSIATGKDGNNINNPILDQILERAKPDLLVKVNLPKELKLGGSGKKYIEITMEIIDAYTSIAISSVILRSAESFLDMNQQIEAAIEGGIMDVEAKMRAYFQKMVQNGRPIRLYFKTSGELDFETELGADLDELADIVRNWVVANAYEGQANHEANTPTEYSCSPRISLEFQDAREFLNGFRQLMKEYGLSVRRQSKGPGIVYVTLSKG